MVTYPSLHQNLYLVIQIKTLITTMRTFLQIIIHRLSPNSIINQISVTII